MYTHRERGRANRLLVVRNQSHGEESGLLVRIFLLLLDVQELSDHLLSTVVLAFMASKTEANKGRPSGDGKDQGGLLDGGKGLALIPGLGAV